MSFGKQKPFEPFLPLLESEVCRYPLQTTCVSLGGKEGSLTKLGKKNLDFFYFCDVTRLNVHFFFISGPSLQIFPLIRYQIENNCVKLSIGMVNKIHTVTWHLAQCRGDGAYHTCMRIVIDYIYKCTKIILHIGLIEIYTTNILYQIIKLIDTIPAL